MADGRRGAALDLFRLAAVVLVVANHTSPLASVSPLWDFWFTRVLARVAVPFFLMVSGYFLAKDQWRRTGVFLKKTCLLYGAAVLLYLPLNWYNGGYGPAEWVKKLLLDGTFYHLWYFPGVILGVLAARGLLRLGPRTALTAAGLLYLVGLGGDSYYGLTCQLPALEALYGEIFQIFAYTRNGLFFTPLFLLLGAAGVRWSVRTSAAGLCAAFAAMTAEGLWLHGLQVQRHDSMYMLLPLVMVCLFSLLLGLNRGERRSCRKFSSLIYVLHPWCIVLVRGGAELLFSCHHTLLVPGDFLIQQVQRGLHLRHPGHQLVPLFYQQGLAGVQGGVSLLEQVHIFDQGFDLHPGGPHALHQLDPAAGLLPVVPQAAPGAGDRRDQADALVVAKGVR